MTESPSNEGARPTIELSEAEVDMILTIREWGGSVAVRAAVQRGSADDVVPLQPDPGGAHKSGGRPIGQVRRGPDRSDLDSVKSGSDSTLAGADVNSPASSDCNRPPTRPVANFQPSHPTGHGGLAMKHRFRPNVEIPARKALAEIRAGFVP